MVNLKAVPSKDDVHNVAVSNPHSSGHERLPLGGGPSFPENTIVELFCGSELLASSSALLKLLNKKRKNAKYTYDNTSRVVVSVEIGGGAAVEPPTRLVLSTAVVVSVVVVVSVASGELHSLSNII